MNRPLMTRRMTATAQMTPRKPLFALLAVSAAAALTLSACGGGSGQSGSPVTVTVTPTVTASGKQPAGKAKKSEPAKATSDVAELRNWVSTHLHLHTAPANPPAAPPAAAKSP